MKAGRVVRAVVLLALTARAQASERSELLATQAQAAYRAGRVADAQERFAAAVADDPRDADAQYGLGLALAKLGRFAEAAPPLEAALALRPDFDPARRALALVASHRTRAVAEASAKRWEARGTAGFAYDSNPALEPHGIHDHRDQATFILGAHGRYDVVQRETGVVRLDYDLYQTLLPDFGDFDFRAHQIAATGSWAARPWAWLGVQGGYDHYSLGSHAYLQEPFVMPFAWLTEGDRGRTRLLYRHGEEDYLSAPFDGGSSGIDRDGRLDAAGVTQTLLFESARWASLGYQFEHESPSHASGSDFERDSHRVYAGVGFPAWWRTGVELAYVYQNDDYPNPNRFSPTGASRHDDDHRLYAAVRRTLAEHLDVALAYRGTVNRSNIGLFDYRRSVASLVFELTY